VEAGESPASAKGGNVKRNFAMAVAMGAAIGAAIGAATHNMGVSVAIGVAIGAALGMVWSRNIGSGSRPQQ
jgi:uncharacterized membrane protein